MADVLVDTDVFIDHLCGARRLAISDGDSAAYSVVTLYELFAGSHVDEAAVRTMLSPFTALNIDPGVAERAGRIRRQTGTGIADALIASTALEHSLALMTRNVRHFERVSQLQVIQPDAT